MPKINPDNKSVLKLRGLHLYHAGWSNCSMRVRMTLEEKALSWTSHHLNTRTGEHITPEYFGIHPRGLVPTLVHDGDVWIESNDIIRYLDDTYPDPRLTPVGKEQLLKLSAWSRLASAIHVKAVKAYVYSSGPTKRRKSAAELERYAELQTDAELLAFHAKSSSADGLTEQDRRSAEELLQAAFAQLDAHLKEHAWLAGKDFSLADITWVPLKYTLEKVGFSFNPYENVLRWSRAIEARPSYQKAVVEWFDGPPASS